MSTHQQLEQLLAHPSVWRGRSRATVNLFHGFAALDAGLPGGGWPRHGLVEILTPRPGVGELYLLCPRSRHCRVPRRRAGVPGCHRRTALAPALQAHGVELNRMLIVRYSQGLTPHDGTRRPLMEEGDGVNMDIWRWSSSRSGACGMALAWLPRASPRAIRRLQLAAEGRALGVLYCSQQFAHVASPAMLRVLLEPRWKVGDDEEMREHKTEVERTQRGGRGA